MSDYQGVVSVYPHPRYIKFKESLFTRFDSKGLDMAFAEDPVKTIVELEAGEVEEDDGPSFTFPLVEDLNRKDQLFGFHKKALPSPDPISYRSSEKQLLQEGKLGASEFSARLQKVIFGTYEGKPACLIAFQANFAPKNRGWFRFRDATIQAETEDAEDVNSVDIADDDDDEYHEIAEDQSSKGTLVVRFHPSLVHGPVQTAAETYGISLQAPIAPPGIGVNISGGWSITAPRVSSHLIQGALTGRPETGVKWTMKENDVSKSGIYEQPTFAMIVRFKEERGFILTLNMKATTYGGLAVTGKSGSRIKFMRRSGGAQENEGTMAGLNGGAIQVGSRIWGVKEESPKKSGDMESGQRGRMGTVLNDIDLEQLTQVEANLLGQHGPSGGGAPAERRYEA